MRKSYTLEYLIVSFGAAVVLSLVLFSGLIPYGIAYLILGLVLLACAAGFTALADHAILRRKTLEETSGHVKAVVSASVGRAA